MKRTLMILLVASLATFAAGPRAGLSGITSWAFQLQDPDIDTLEQASPELVVIDYSTTGGPEGEFTYAEIERLRDSGKTVLAYFSIGEAESYRFYWKSNWRVGKPGFISDENPYWDENYKVKYWSGGWWKKGLQPYLDRILDAGFDGVYLDIVDAYWWWHDEKGHSYKKTANRMCKLVEKIALYARARAGDGFIVCPQNAVSILDDASTKWRNRYLAAIDAVGVESLYYNIWSSDDHAYRLAKLQQFDDADKKILVVEYIDESEWAAFFDKIAESGMNMIGYPADPDYELDELIVTD